MQKQRSKEQAMQKEEKEKMKDVSFLPSLLVLLPLVYYISFLSVCGSFSMLALADSHAG